MASFIGTTGRARGRRRGGGAGDTKDFGCAVTRFRGVGLPVVDVEVAAGPRHADAFRIDDLRILSTEEFAGRHAERLACLVERFDDVLEVIALEKRVGIAEQDELAPGGGDALIHGGREAAIFSVADDGNGQPVTGNRFRAAVDRRVVDHDQLDVGPALLCDGFETARKVLRAVPGHEDDGGESSHRLNAFFATLAYARTDGQRPLPFANPASDAAQRSSMPAMISQRSPSHCPGVNHFRAYSHMLRYQTSVNRASPTCSRLAPPKCFACAAGTA